MVAGYLYLFPPGFYLGHLSNLSPGQTVRVHRSTTYMPHFGYSWSEYELNSEQIELLRELLSSSRTRRLFGEPVGTIIPEDISSYSSFFITVQTNPLDSMLITIDWMRFPHLYRVTFSDHGFGFRRDRAFAVHNPQWEEMFFQILELNDNE